MDVLPLNTRDMVPVEVPHEPAPVVYHLRVPTILDRQRWRREVAALGAHYPAESELYDAMRADVRDQIDAADVERLIALIDACEAEQDRISEALAHLAAGDEAPRNVMVEILGDEGARTFVLLEQELRRRGGAYARLVADRAYYVEVATTLAVAHFLTRVDGLGELRLERRGGRLSDETLDLLPPHHLGIVGARALALMRPDGRARKNSASSPNTSGTRASSPAAGGRPKARGAGGSAGRSMKKTRSSRSTTSGGSS